METKARCIFGGGRWCVDTSSPLPTCHIYGIYIFASQVATTKFHSRHTADTSHTPTHGGLATDILNGKILRRSIRSFVDSVPAIKSMRCRCTNRSVGNCIYVGCVCEPTVPWLERHTDAWMYFIGFITIIKIWMHIYFCIVYVGHPVDVGGWVCGAV